jgi:hypothetical protein
VKTFFKIPFLTRIGWSSGERPPDAIRSPLKIINTEKAEKEFLFFVKEGIVLRVRLGAGYSPPIPPLKVREGHRRPPD